MQKKFYPTLVFIVLFLTCFLSGMKQLASQQIPRISDTGTRSTQQTTGTTSATIQETKAEPVKPAAVQANEAFQNKTEPDEEADISQALELYQRNDFDAAKAMLDDICKKDTKLPPPGIFLVQFAAACQQEERIRYWLDQAT